MIDFMFKKLLYQKKLTVSVSLFLMTDFFQMENQPNVELTNILEL